MSPVLDSAPSDPATRRVPTTEAQREIWTAAQLGDAASLGFNEAVALTLDGPLDRDALQRALEVLIARHEALRARCADDGRAFVLEPEVQPTVQWLDWSDRETGAQDAALAAHERELVDTPFDLAAGPLTRITIVRRAADRHVLTIAAHHIVCDGWSFGVLARELGALYSAACRHTPAGLPPADTLAAYAASERDEAESEEAEAAELFWTTRFREEPTPLELPLDHPRPRQRRFESGRIDHQLAPALVRGLRELAQANGSTLFATLLSGFATLLHRIAGADDVVIGIPTAGQARLGTPRLVSHCVNLLPVRVFPQPAQPFTDFQRVVQGALLDAMEHQQLTFGALLKLLPIARDPARLPLVSVVFNVDRGLGDSELGFDGLHATFRAVPRTFENFELFLNVVEYGEQLSL
ncbi:MAG TPA: condensation domain-containing protein, partial [Gemmatimonadaceae bacterium]|nr:condensation domain-containing protein [Gemmatimonadaceae bacterium]